MLELGSALQPQGSDDPPGDQRVAGQHLHPDGPTPCGQGCQEGHLALAGAQVVEDVVRADSGFLEDFQAGGVGSLSEAEVLLGAGQMTRLQPDIPRGQPQKVEGTEEGFHLPEAGHPEEGRPLPGSQRQDFQGFAQDQPVICQAAILSMSLTFPMAACTALCSNPECILQLAQRGSLRDSHRAQSTSFQKVWKSW